MDTLLFFLGSYLVGSIPVAYLLVKWSGKVDIRTEGSGNVGGFNAYVVTHSKWVGILVGVLDSLKGFLVVLLAEVVFPGSFLYAGIALIGAITGHNYSIWIGFRGGRGLATAAGGMILLGFGYAVIWCSLWILARVARRDILVSNLSAILLTPLLLWLVPWDWVQKLHAAPVDQWPFVFYSCMLSLLLLLSHLDTVRDVWKDPQKGELRIPTQTS